MAVIFSFLRNVWGFFLSIPLFFLLLYFFSVNF
jgi:hypothetical protein